MSTKKSELWQRLRAARQAAGLTQQVIADACGVSRTAVALWTSQDPDTRTTPSLPHLRSFAELVGVPLDWLLSDIRQGDHLFCFAKTPEQVAEKMRQLALEPAKNKHLVVLDNAVDILTAADASAALSAVISKLK